MQFTGSLKENLWLSTLTEDNIDILTQAIKTGLTILWNKEDEACISVDGIDYFLKQNQIVFFTEFHKLHAQKIKESRLLRFNRPFYCIKSL